MNSFNFSFLKSLVFWTNAVTVVYLFFGAILKAYPSVGWVNVVVLALNFILTNVFHKSAVMGGREEQCGVGTRLQRTIGSLMNRR